MTAWFENKRSTMSGIWDMEKSVYDPQNINDDAFDRANHTWTQALSTIAEANSVAFICDNQFAVTDYTFDWTERRNSAYLVTTASSRTINIDADLFSAWYEVTLCKWTNNTNTVTLDAQSGNNINWSQTFVLTQYNEVVTLVKDWANTWKIKSHYYPTSVLAPIDSPVFTTKIQTPTIELWNTSDTTISRVSPWVVAVEWTNIKLDSMATNKLLWRWTAWTWAIEEITLWTWLSLSWTTLNATWWGGTQKIRITIPGEIITDTSVQQWFYFYNDTGATITISNVAFTVSKAAAWTWAGCAFNIYKSSGTSSDWIDTNAVNLFTSAVNLTTNYTSLTNTPNTTTVENGRYVSARVTSSAGATNKASNAQIIISYS